MGDELRSAYSEIPEGGCRQLRTALGNRRKVVDVSLTTASTWLAQYAAPSSGSSASASGRCLKRPAAAAGLRLSVAKRPAAASVVAEVEPLLVEVSNCKRRADNDIVWKYLTSVWVCRITT